ERGFAGAPPGGAAATSLSPLAGYVEGFHAARLERIGAQGFLRAERTQEAHGGAFRIASGYDRVLAWIHDAALAEGALLHLGAEVRAVRWRPGHVALTGTLGGEERTWTAPRALLTWPLGVWKRADGDPAAVRLEPELPEKRRALAG